MTYQRQNWSANDSGILRKKDENEEELLVFGYSCKLFRDDEKALYVDQGKHLIPWMGDDSLRIDRYDVRGALYDLSQFEAKPGQREDLYWIDLSTEERRMEQLCDEERYRALTHNEDEERLYQEEELKRLHQALGSDKTYGQVSYSYDEENGNGESEKSAPENPADDPDEPFVPPPELELPTTISVPDTVKLNAIIEKTAMFIHQQGSQMEIILKMKQATNPQFEFLSYRSPLHSYYRHVLAAIKSGRYKPKVQTASNTDGNKTDEENASTDQNYYLHHTLSQVPVSSVDVAPVIPSISYKPSADCAYSMLVNKIRNNQNKMGLLSSLSIETSNETVTDGCKASETISSPKLYDPTESIDDNCEGNDSETKPSSPRPVSTSQRSNRRKRRKRPQGAFAYTDLNDTDSMDGVEESLNEPDDTDMVEQRETPPTDLQLIIEKMASYVGKNGRDFEEIVKSKADPRFSFLDSSSPYYWFYREKLEFYEQLQKPPDGFVESCSENNVNADNADKDNHVENDGTNNVCDSAKTMANKPNPVCFSIKRPKETENLEIKSALPIEESTDEENEENGENEGSNNNKVNSVDNNVEQSNLDGVNVRSSDDKKGSVVVPEKQKESKVKVKLSSKEKEKQLQLERKKRAAAFLNMIHKTTKKSPKENPEQPVMIGPQLPEDQRVCSKSDSVSGNEDDAPSDSVSSPPSSVTSPEVTFISESTNEALQKTKTVQPPPLHGKRKRSKHSLADNHVVGHRPRERDGVEYKHKHRKRKRSRTPSRKHSHSTSRSSHFRRDDENKGKHRKHHRHHRKEWRHVDRGEYNVVQRRHKHYKSKRHKRREEKKHGNGSDDSDAS